jgi:hypothetical protein
MDAKLVRAARVQSRFDEGEAAEKQLRFPIGARGPAFAPAGGHSHAPMQIAGYGQFDSSCRRLQLAVEQRNVNFLDFALLKFFHELSMRRVISRHDQCAGSSFVEAVHNSRAQRSADGGERAEAIEKRGRQRSQDISAPGMHHHSGGLVDDGEVLIFVKDIQRDRFRRYSYWLRRRYFDCDNLAGLEAVGRFRGDAIHANTTFGNQCLEPCAAEIGSVGGEKAVEAHACIFVFDGKG